MSRLTRVYTRRNVGPTRENQPPGTRPGTIARKGRKEALMASTTSRPGHVVTVGWVPNNHGYPYRATCSCGWQSRTYAATHAAQIMADEHVS